MFFNYFSGALLPSLSGHHFVATLKKLSTLPLKMSNFAGYYNPANLIVWSYNSFYKFSGKMPVI